MKISNYRRSVSRSPPPNGQPRSNSSLYRPPDPSNQLPAKSTTSWGKLKHSKSSSSNIGCSQESDENQQVPSRNEVPPSTSSPSLFRLFQNSKQAQIESSGETPKRPMSLTPDLGTSDFERPSTAVKTTSFSQIRQRSVSSCPIVKNETGKKSVGVQHPPLVMDQGMQTSTIVCMLLDRKSAKTSEELMAVAARAARAAVSAARRNSAKSSLPDLTFLKDYADEKKPEIKDSFTSTTVRQIPNSGSDLLKRKTLKSIKRYRQTKQNTEPCAPNEKAQENVDNSLSSSSNSGSSSATNTSGYASTAPQIQRQVSLSSQAKQPLKSCLKRKDSQNIPLVNKVNFIYLYSFSFFIFLNTLRIFGKM